MPAVRTAGDDAPLLATPDDEARGGHDPVVGARAPRPAASRPGATGAARRGVVMWWCGAGARWTTPSPPACHH